MVSARCLLACLWLFHPFYVSVTEINISKNKPVEISCRIFYDDLERTLEKQVHSPVDIVKPADKKKMDAWINDYIQKHLAVTADGKRLVLSYVGYEIQEDAAWIYLENKETGPFKKIEVRDDLLFSEHPEQLNIVHVIVDGQRKSTKLENPAAEAAFIF
jgi:hypothetical protein